MQDDDGYILRPYDRREAISVRIAATIAGKSTRTIQAWCAEHGIGRRVGRGNWQVSRVALSMWLDGDERALRAYKAGDRSSERVACYFARAGLKIPQNAQDSQ
jgi:hypothetical protein